MRNYSVANIYATFQFHKFFFISFAGLSPTEHTSGTALKVQAGSIKKVAMRDVLYICAMNARQTKPACQALYDRLKANGKTGKQALIAAMNKLLKQAYT